MATIQKRTTKDGKPSYRVQIRLKGFPQATASFERLTDAKEWAAKTERAIKEHRYFGAARKHTFGDLVEKYSKHAAERLKDWPDRERCLNHWLDALGDCALDHVTAERIAAERDRLKGEITNRGKERSGATVNRYLAALSACLGFAVKELHWLGDNPCRRVSKPKEAPGRVRYLSEEEMARLLAACKESSNPDLHLAVVLSLTTGGRQGEIMGLRWRQVDFKGRRITLNQGETKNGEARMLPLAGQAFDLLQARAKVRTLHDDRVFPPTARAKKAERMDLRFVWGEALKRAEIEDFHWHDLRHTAASYLAMNGVSPLLISKILGHRTMAMVSRYSHLAPEGVSALGEALAQRMGLK